jgi:hypothetical protein
LNSIPPSEHQLLAKIRAHESWAQCEDRSRRTAPGRKAFNDRFEQQVDPDGKLSPSERQRRAEHARKAYFARLALKSAQSRRKAKAARSQADQLDQVAAQAEAELGGGAA